MSNIIIIGKNYQQKLSQTISLELYIKDFKNIRELLHSYINSRNILTGNVNHILIHNADELPKSTQYLLRAILERNVRSCRFIFLTEHINNIIEPLQSRCLIQYCDTQSVNLDFHRDNTLTIQEKYEIIRQKLKMN